ncbi:hypothetical protein ACFVAV_23340 [Nocardia sp. NPDC057663]|uniref:hypothetical protein n=1 Tax=Nocardia sp. NPDC057663 TaxID=3346201 RepID=UPI00367284E0
MKLEKRFDRERGGINYRLTGPNTSRFLLFREDELRELADIINQTLEGPNRSAAPTT